MDLFWKENGPKLKTNVNKQKHVVCGETPLGADKTSENHQHTRGEAAASAKPPLPRPDSQFLGDCKPQYAPTTGLLEARTRNPPAPLPSPLGPSFPEAQSTLGLRPGSCTYRRRVRFLNYLTLRLSKAPPPGPEVVFYRGRRRDIREQRSHGTT